jgi:hypothetical protein
MACLLDYETRASAAEGEVRRIFKVTDGAGLKKTISELSVELNREVRKQIEFSVGLEETRVYHANHE